MQRPDVKICGLSTRETIDAALSRGASHVGFVHFLKSPRHLDLRAMAELAGHVGARARTVVVTVDPDDGLLDEIARLVRPDMIQLHGRETPERVAAVRARTGLGVMKAISIGTPEDVAGVARYREAADRLLLDAKRPKDSVLPGGNGVSFDWRLLAALDPALAPMLSGGLDAGNVGAALAIARPAGLDVSSGVESAPGVKDVSRIHSFFDALELALGGQDRARAS
ncbi:phosphoribosylanthranilate isomerase [Aurantimonas sp. Leaf443]|uniref:phosphoribosylanthranilate isomerase n=1 Tax=Aurantimonas sp. Leaf443 TaxID=1736378 RepID=UPI0006F5EA7E|nr:phosphoribosylanthranilate isomerase [Aurantimonas sp. Leaf443]KQT83988.1 N-(5'-phosphoribosyl)anthranilate isomerase [Aurantimonas sp. Leaf443]